ncbi:hypothetical protein OSB04_000801 [Centaurea solstitialis]|uniref:Myb-like domain-containing protein n=1 Tax=Centaurea solstitialis TaxID=347529 RepID=A0AA38U1J7_9ASTR|nr:hypothetical protein OSB04_000801 [Centaurea solstitialis]
MEVEKLNPSVLRDYRKGNWTVEETMILIEAKKLDEQRRSTTIKTTTKPTELRWKWIEEHCWKKGCFRSQNQCNDKWDNLMRDFKKIREFERRTRSISLSSLIKSDNNINNGDDDDGGSGRSYWKMEKLERKSHNLPSNMLPQIYEALAHVVEGKMGISVIPTTTTVGFHRPCTTTAATGALPLPPSRPPFGGGGVGDQLPLPTQGKRRKSNEEGSNLIETIKWYEEREETRHKELYIMHQKRYKIEESRIEMERQGFNELVDINSLSNSILAFTSSQRTPP